MKFIPRKWLAPASWTRVCAALASGVVVAMAGCGGDSGTAEIETIVEANLDTQAATIGGATTAATYYADTNGAEWALYSMANRFAVTPVGVTQGAVHEITVAAAIQHITPVRYSGRDYALLSLGGGGISVVDITTPTAPTLVSTVNVNYEKTGVTYVDGGGNVVADATISGTAGKVTDTLTDGTTLWIANAAYGIHRTALSNLLPTPVTEADGTLVVDAETWTLQYAGENPWGGPLSLKLHGGRIYAALGFLGMGIYDATTLAREGGYNLYADTSVSEDWFGSQRLTDPGVLNVSTTDGIDATTGMPTWQEAQYELQNKRTATSFPWASFDRYGKYYYNARALDLVDLAGGRVMAYVAYSLGGLVAVDVTPGQNPTYAGYVPAAPAHGPDEPTGQQARSILSHFGSGMLKEAGVMDVRVRNGQAYYSDHFAGLVVVSGADNPGANWHGPNGRGGYNNDTNPQAFWPDYEFVTSYDMTPVPVGDESMPRFLTEPYEAPVMLVTGEISGHGGALFLMPTLNTGAAGQVDLVQATGAGGLNFIDIKDFNGATLADRFEVPARFVSTAEMGAAEDGSATQVMAIGHAEGLAVSGNHLYLGDGPHGMSVWRITDGNGPTDNLHIVANTLQSEYPTGDVLPTPHAFTVAFGDNPNHAYVLSQSLGLRRVDVSAVTGGTAQVGAPSLLRALPSGIFEHSSESGGNLGNISGQDHAYGVAFSGQYAIVADGGNGLTVYDTTVDATTGNHVVANIGGDNSGRPILGRAASVKLWTNPATGRKYAIVAAGAYGVSVVDMTELLVNGVRPGMTLLKTFEPIKLEEDRLGSADGKSVDVHVVGEHAYFSYDSFGLVAYKLSDLIKPLADVKPECAGVDPTQLTERQGGVECRPEAVGHFQLQTVPGYETVDGGALHMTPQYFPANKLLRNAAGEVYMLSQPRLLFYVAYGDAGAIKVDWSNPAQPVLLARQDTVGSASATAIANGRVYVADGVGGLVVFK